MKTTLDLPDDLVLAVKLRALKENRKLKDMVARLLRQGLERRSERPPTAGNRVALPLVECAHGASSGGEMTPDRVADELLTQEIGADRGPLR